jgi:hypothetical protein
VGDHVAWTTSGKVVNFGKSGGPVTTVQGVVPAELGLDPSFLAYVLAAGGADGGPQLTYGSPALSTSGMPEATGVATTITGLAFDQNGQMIWWDNDYNPDDGIRAAVPGMPDSNVGLTGVPPARLAADPSWVFWTLGGSRVYRMARSTGMQLYIMTTSAVVDVAVDPLADGGGDVYWLQNNGVLCKGVKNPLPTGCGMLASGLTNPTSLALQSPGPQTPATYAYWAESPAPTDCTKAGQVTRLALDGSSSTEVVAGSVKCPVVAFDSTAGYVYWSDGTAIFRLHEP